MERRFAAILATDVVGYSRLMGEDEVGTLQRLKSLHKALVQPPLASENPSWCAPGDTESRWAERASAICRALCTGASFRTND